VVGLLPLAVGRLMPSEVVSIFIGSPVLSPDPMRDTLQPPESVLDRVISGISGPLSLESIASTVQHQLTSAVVSPVAGGGRLAPGPGYDCTL
jgi:hypothetical protein